MTKEQDLDRFLDEFAIALDGAQPTQGLRAAMNASKKLVERLRAVADSVDVDDQIAIAEDIGEHLKTLSSSGAKMPEMIKRGRAIVDLEGFVDDEVVARARELVAQAEAKKLGRGSGRGHLPVPVTAYCRECEDNLIASSAGAQNWGTVRFRIRKHATEAHGGIPPDLKKRVMALRTQLHAGSTREEFGPYIVEVVPS